MVLFLICIVVFNIYQANSYGLLQIICEYYRLPCPERGSTVRFHPLEHLIPLEYSRPQKTVLRVAGSSIDLKSCTTSLELAEVNCKLKNCIFILWVMLKFNRNWSLLFLFQARTALFVEEEASALSIWTVATICGALRLENV